MTDIERISNMLNVIHKENGILAELIINASCSPDKANPLVDKIKKEWDEVFNLAAFGEYDENGKLVYAE